MNLVGAAVVPAAPILVPGMSQHPPPELQTVRDVVDEAVAALPPHDLLLLLAGAWRAEDEGVHVGGLAHLGELSRPDLAAGIGGWPFEAERVAAATGLAPCPGPLSLDLSVLALLAWPSAEAAGADGALPIAVGFHDAGRLAAIGSGIAAALAEPIPLRVAVVAAGDLAAGHTEKAPRHLVDGSGEWDDRAERVVETGAWGDLGALGPDEARRVSARGWPALVVLGALLGDRPLHVRCRQAPRGVGYLVAST